MSRLNTCRLSRGIAGDGKMGKTLNQAGKEFHDAWRDFGLALDYSLKVDKVLDFLTKRLDALGKWLDARQSL